MKKNYQLMIRTVVLLCMLQLTSISLNANEIPEIKNVPINNILESNDTLFKELMNSIEAGECYNINYTGVALRSNRTGLYSYTSHGNSYLEIDKSNKTKLKSGDIKTSFSDRSNFAGKKDILSILFSTNNSRVYAEITLKTWGNHKINLRNLRVSKNKFGYFITTYSTSSSSSTYYTFAIYKTNCII